MSSSQRPVLIVGAGPTGLTLACEIARRGVAVRIVDRATGPSSASKGIALWGRSLEVLDGLGVADRAVARGLPFVANCYYSSGKRIARIPFSPLPGTRFGQPISLPQPHLERILGERLATLGVEVEWDTRLTALWTDADRAHATLAGNRATESLEAEWIVGCDGAKSSVRALVGIDFPGRTYGPPILLADGKLESDLAAGELHVFMAASGACVVVPMPDGLSRVYVSALSSDDADRPVPTLEAIQQLIDVHSPVGMTMREPHWMSVFRAQSRRARTWRQGRAILAGDAAHAQSPAGGQGMNLAIRDAHNLGWKLATVVSGAAPEPMLESYERERSGVAARVLRETDQQMRALSLSSRPARALRDALFKSLDRHGMMAKQRPAMAGLRDNYRGGPLNLQGGSSRRSGGLRVGQRLPDADLIDARNGAIVPLIVLLRDPRFSLFLRAGADADQPFIQRIRARFGADVAVRIVLDGDRPPADWADSAFLDPTTALFPPNGGIDALLVRPDGHLGAVLGPGQEARLMAYLEQTLRPVLAAGVAADAPLRPADAAR